MFRFSPINKLQINKFTQRLVVPGHVVVLLATLYYSTVLASVVFSDGNWGRSVLRGIPVFLIMSLAWLYFYNFKVLRYTFIYIAISSWSFFISFASYMLQTGGILYAQISYKNAGFFAWSPYVFFWGCLYIGLLKRCPKCNIVNGIYGRRVIRQDYDGSSRSTRNVIVNTPGIITSGPLTGSTINTSSSQQVTYTTNFYKVHCQCKVCGFRWTYTKTTGG